MLFNTESIFIHINSSTSNNSVTRFKTSINEMKHNGFKLAKGRSRRYPARTIMNVDCTDDIALLANTTHQAETLLHNLERADGGIDLHVNADKTESKKHLHTKWWAFETSGQVHLSESSVSSTETDINIGQLSIGYWSYRSQTWLIK